MGKGPGAAESTTVQMWVQQFPGVLKMGPWANSIKSPEILLEIQIPGSTGLKTQGLGAAICVLISPPGCYDAYSSVRTSVLGKGAGDGRIQGHYFLTPCSADKGRSY